MTKEEVTKILARMLETDANDTFLAPSERSAVLFALQDMNAAEKKAPTLPQAEAKKTWISAPELPEEITKEITKEMQWIVKETVEAERRILELARVIGEAIHTAITSEEFSEAIRKITE